jgi:hypothetical protein
MKHDALQKLQHLESTLPRLWSKDTSAVPKDWDAGNPALNQCAPTALLVNDLMGGDIVRATYRQVDSSCGQHYFNIIDGEKVDLTAYQFTIPTTFTPPPDASEDDLREASKAHLVKIGKNADVKDGYSNAAMREYLLRDQAVRKAYTNLKSAYNAAIEQEQIGEPLEFEIPERSWSKQQYHKKHNKRDRNQRSGGFSIYD